MGYRIDYGLQKKIPISQRRKRGGTGILIGIGAVLAVMALRLTGFGEVLWHWILPGDPEVTQTALTAMIEDIRNGSELSDAITAFCREILNGARLS